MIRPATEADLPLVEEAERAYIRDVEPGQEAAWTAALDRNRALWRANLTRTTVVEVGGAPAGFVVWTPDDGTALVVTGCRCCRRSAAAVWAVDCSRSAPARPRRPGTRSCASACTATTRRALYEAAGFAPTGEDGAYLVYRRTAVPAAG